MSCHHSDDPISVAPGNARFQATRGDGAHRLLLRIEVTDTEGNLEDTLRFLTEELEAGAPFTVAADRIYALFFFITRSPGSDQGEAHITLTVGDEILFDEDCSSSGGGFAGDWILTP